MRIDFDERWGGGSFIAPDRKTTDRPTDQKKLLHEPQGEEIRKRYLSIKESEHVILNMSNYYPFIALFHVLNFFFG